MPKEPITLRVTNYPRNRKIKVPSTIQIDATTTVDDVKKQITKAAGMRDYNRIAIIDPQKRAILKDPKAILTQDRSVMDAQEIMVKDLGPQVAWRTVYMIEYAAPILIHLLLPLIRQHIYGAESISEPISPVQKLTMAMVVFHFIKRELETVFVHKFSNATMPLYIVFKNSFHYWILAGFNIAYWVYSPTAIAARPLSDDFSRACVYSGVVLYVFGLVANFQTHLVLSCLRSRGGMERGIPKGFGFNWVTCPNYLFETIAWIGICLVTRSLSTVLFLTEGIIQMVIWAEGREKRYRLEFGDKYKPKKYPYIPGIPYRGGKKSKR